MNRRDFLKGAMIAAASAGCAVPLAAKQNISPNGLKSQINTPGIIGAVGSPISLDFFPYELQLRHTFTVATSSRSSTPDVQVEVHWEGLTGYGEASMPPYLSAELGTTESCCRFLEKVKSGIGQFDDPMRLDDILSWTDSLGEGDAAAKAAVDIAMHDLVGKMLGAPWHRIWGLDKAKAPSTTYTISIGDAETVRNNTLECASRFNVLKVKLGRDNDREIIETIRTVTDLPLCVDVNQGWKDPAEAIDMIHWLKEQGVVMVEQPMHKTRLDDIARITEASPLPVFADESVQRLADISPLKGVFSGINIKLMKCTGMREAHKMLTTARALGMNVMIGCMTETSCAVSAAAQLSPAVDFADLDGNLLIANDRFRGVEVVDGRLILPDRPGIGVVTV